MSPNNSYAMQQQQQIHHQPLNQRQQIMEPIDPIIPNELKIHVVEELLRNLGIHADYSQIERLMEDIGEDSDLLAQFLGCAYDHIYEPEAVIIQEEQHVTKTNHFTMSFRVHLKLLRLRALVVFLCFKLCKNHPDQQCGIWLVEKMSEGLLLLDVDALSEVSCSAFFDQLQVIEQTLRFEAELSHPSAYIQVKNNTMNNIRLKSNENDKLIASFEDVSLLFLKRRNCDDDSDMNSCTSSSSSSSSDDDAQIIHEYDTPRRSNEEAIKLCLLIHIGKFMTFVKNGQKTFRVRSDGKSYYKKMVHDEESSYLSVNELLPRYGSYYTNGLVQMGWNREFFVTPKRENTDIYFMVKFGDKRVATVDALFIDHMRVSVPCEDIETYFRTSDDDSSNSSGDSPLAESITVPVSVLHNHRELTHKPLQYTFWTSTRFAEPGSSGMKRTLIGDDQMPFPMEDEDLEYMMSGTTIASPVETPMRKKPRLDLNHHEKGRHVLLHRARDPCGFTLLHSAAFRGYTKLVHLLVDKQHFVVDQRDHYHFTPLHWACYSGHIDLAMFLMKRGASPTLQNMFALTAPDIAEEQNHMELWHAMDSELQRQACCALFTLYSAKTENDDDKSLKKKTQTPPQVPQRRHSDASPSSLGASTCQPATLIKKTPKGVDTRTQIMELFIKPSRKKRTYISFFPNELCSSPYKYDILLRIPLHFTNQFNELQFTFHLLIQGTDQQWQRVNQADAVEVVKYLRTMFPLNYREIEWRIMFRVCSFHFHRKPFKFQVVYNSKLQNQVPASAREEQQQQQQHLMESALGDIEGHHQSNSTVDTEKKNTLTDDSVVFESEPFFIVARKKKRADEFFDRL
jgi:hypothetical protein